MKNFNVLVLILAGGEGRRLLPLTQKLCKPAVAFAGSLRLVDFTLFNCFASGLSTLHLLTQYRPETLEDHIADRWSSVAREAGGAIKSLRPAVSYSGTADAAFQSLWLIERARPEVVLILSADHVYRADYQRVIREHLEGGADVTVLAGRQPAAAAPRFGVLGCSSGGRIRSFIEKPASAAPWSVGGVCDINLGVYCFRPEALSELLRANAVEASHDFGRDILPAAVKSMSVAACPLERAAVGGSLYWRDVGTVDSYFEAGMDLLGDPPRFELADPRWSEDSPFRTWLPARTPAAVRRNGPLFEGWNLVSAGARLHGADLIDCIVSPGAQVGSGARLERCILLPGARVGPGARLGNVIVDEGANVPPWTIMGRPGRFSNPAVGTVAGGGTEAWPARAPV